MLVLLAPGQGSQAAGMLTPWLHDPEARSLLESWSRAVGRDLLALGTRGTAEQVQPTEVAQPLLVAAALLSARALDLRPDVLLGHSVGELAALAMAGVLTEIEAIRLAAVRGEAMARAAAARPTGMLAVLGGQPEEVRRAAADAGLEVATVNGASQLVLGGSLDALSGFVAPVGARTRRLAVAGAFHTSAMEPAVEAVRNHLATLHPSAATCPVVCNADGAAVVDGRELLDRLPSQLTSAVRFDRCLQTFAELGIQEAVELAPGGTLARLVRALPGLSATALRSPEDLVVAHAAARPAVPA